MHWWSEKCLYMLHCHLYCLDCICREVLFSHLECKFLKGITIYDTPCSTTELHLDEGFLAFQPSGHQKSCAGSGGGGGVRAGPIAAEIMWSTSSPGQTLYPIPMVSLAVCGWQSLLVFKMHQEVKAKQKPNFYRKARGKHNLMTGMINAQKDPEVKMSRPHKILLPHLACGCSEAPSTRKDWWCWVSKSCKVLSRPPWLQAGRQQLPALASEGAELSWNRSHPQLP